MSDEEQETKKLPPALQKVVDANVAAKRSALIRSTTHYILREWIAQTVGASPAFAADNAGAAMAAAKMYVETCEAMAFD